MINSLFGCTHRRTTFPITPGRRGGQTAGTSETRGKTYVACLDCGKEFDYDWKTMRIGEPVHIPVATGQAAVHTL